MNWYIFMTLSRRSTEGGVEYGLYFTAIVSLLLQEARVVSGLEWPGLFCLVLASTPALCRMVAKVSLNLCRPTSLIPARMATAFNVHRNIVQVRPYLFGQIRLLLAL
jgi:hypothetical protein